MIVIIISLVVLAVWIYILERDKYCPKCGTKKELPSKLVSLITDGMAEGWVNITKEQIEKSKWNK